MADLIERKDALAKLIALRKDNAEYSCKNDIMRGKDIAYENAMDIIARIPAVNRWIPCSERLPTPDIAILISDNSQCVSKAWYDDAMHRFNISDSNYWYDESDVLAWAPLPDSYELPKKTDEIDDGYQNTR